MDLVSFPACLVAGSRPVTSALHLLILWGSIFFSVSIAGISTSRADESGAPVLSLVGSVTFDSNVARSSESLATLRGLVPEDEMYSPAVLLNFNKSLGAETLYIKGLAGYDFYQSNSILNAEHIDLGVGVKRQLGICGANIGGAYVALQSDLNNLTAPVASNIATTRSVAVGADCDTGGRFAGHFSISPIWVINSARLLASTNRRAVVTDIGIDYKQPDIGKVSLFGEYNSTDLPNTSLSLAQSGIIDGYDLYGGGIRFDRNSEGRINVTTSISVISLNPRDRSTPGFEGIAFELTGKIKLMSRMSGEFGVLRTVNPSDRLGAAYSIDNTRRAQIEYQAGARTLIAIEARVGKQRFYGDQANSGGDLTNQSIRSIQGRFSYAARSNLSVVLALTKERGTANISAYGYNDDRVELALSSAL